MINDLLISTIHLVNQGQYVYPDLAEKAKLILFGLVFAALFSVALFYFYRKHFWQDASARRLFWISVLVLALVCVLKYVIFIFWKGYLPDRLLFFAIPSPKFGGVLWLLPIGASLALLFLWRARLALWLPRKFLAALWLIFVLFSVGVAGVREGAGGIAEPFTRTHWEYTGSLPLVTSIPDFLRDYTALQPELSEHAKTHPPGYVLLLYLLQTVFSAEAFGLALLIAALGGLFVFPVYYFWKQFMPEDELRRVMPVFIFTPSLVMFSATSMDIVTPVFFWLALLVSFLGWRKGGTLSFAGGMLSGAALLMNFLFLAFGVVFLFFLIYVLQQTDREDRQAVVGRALLSLGGFVCFFALLYASTGYSIVTNFFAAKAVHLGIVETGAPSVVAYILFAGVNVFAFLFYLGIPHLVLFFKQGVTHLVRQGGMVAALGFYVALAFVLTGLFQGEVERIWLFLTPLFLLPIQRALHGSAIASGAVISLLLFQIIVTQTLFYTYW